MPWGGPLTTHFIVEAPLTSGFVLSADWENLAFGEVLLATVEALCLSSCQLQRKKERKWS